MSKSLATDVDFADEQDELDVAEHLARKQVAAVVSATDWTTETVVTQLKRGNIQLDPRFQRRDAWKRDRKSRFIESLIVGLPIPQIVLAEARGERGKFIVLDGKQRLLAILQFWGYGTGPNNRYALSGLTLRDDLKRKAFSDLASDPDLEDDYNSLVNQAVRTVVIRNWKDSNFLHTVFLRLNTGSVTLSPQELRQALLPGPFSDFVDDAASSSQGLRLLLGLDGPDPRMRDIEILARFLAFRFFADEYPGRMKQFLDDAFEAFNGNWHQYEPKIEKATADFEAGVQELVKTLGDDVARKPGSRQFNRAIFDALIYFYSQSSIRKSLTGRRQKARAAYKHLFDSDSKFVQAVESDTAGAPNTAARLKIWASALGGIVGKALPLPRIPVAETKSNRSSRPSPDAQKRPPISKT